MRYFLAIIIAMLSADRVHAKEFTYTCRVGGKSLNVRVDDVRNILRWRGKVYAIAIQEDCPKFGWRATREGESFDFCTATQGYADFREGDKLIQCDQDR